MLARFCPQPLTLSLFLLILPAAHADISWRVDYEAARRLARQTGRPLLVDFYADWCKPCKEMERTTFRDSAVQRQMNRCVCVRVDIDRQRALARKFGVASIPRLLVIDARDRRLLDALGYRPAETFREELASALRGKPAVDTGDAPQSPMEPPEVATLRSMVESRRYDAWKKRNAVAAERARRRLVEQLAAFEVSDRDRAAALLTRLGDDAVISLIVALAHAKLAVRVAAYDALTRFLADRYGFPPASQPRYDAWAAAPERARMARAWVQWWAKQRRSGSSGPS